jgi:hypothetical protein
MEFEIGYGLAGWHGAQGDPATDTHFSSPLLTLLSDETPVRQIVFLQANEFPCRSELSYKAPST